MVVSDECLLCVWEVLQSYGVWSVCLFSTFCLVIYIYEFMISFFILKPVLYTSSFCSPSQKTFTWVLLTFPNLHIEVGAFLFVSWGWRHGVSSSSTFLCFQSLAAFCIVEFDVCLCAGFFFFFCLCQVKFVCLDLNFCQVITFTMAVFHSK